mmetsp:Transcript_2402/g.16138  ORF Transcript_2402/g.16138 Transcript_2402/m.16138 type:complete len:134 (-) Transcript_2402:82-483(-)
MPFARFVQIGRVALVNYGPEYGTLVVVTDVIDQNRVLVDAPNMVRKSYSLKRLALTDFVVDVPRACKKTTLVKALEEADVVNKFKATRWGQKLAAREAKANTSDFDRYKLMVQRMKKSAAMKRELAKLKKQAA